MSTDQGRKITSYSEQGCISEEMTPPLEWIATMEQTADLTRHDKLNVRVVELLIRSSPYKEKSVPRRVCPRHTVKMRKLSAAAAAAFLA